MTAADDVRRALASLPVVVRQLGADAERDEADIRRALFNRPAPLFEHSAFHVLANVAFDSEILLATGAFGRCVIAVGARGLDLLSPTVDDWREFSRLVAALLSQIGQRDLRCKYLTDPWISMAGKRLRPFRIEIHPRSTAEAVYDTEKLTELQGSAFARLRARRRQLLDSGRLTFTKLNVSTLADAGDVLTKWQRTQGGRYTNDRSAREAHMLRVFVEIGSALPEICSFEVGYIAGEPLSLACLQSFIGFPGRGAIYLVKGINRPGDGGVPGLSDATYCRVFENAHRAGLRFVNDGDLGQEAGTRDHKLRFQPVEFQHSYDLRLTDVERFD